MTKAFFLINIQYTNQSNAVFQPGAELAVIPSIKRVVEVSGVYDLLVEIETSGKITEISELLMAKPWVKRLHILRGVQTDTKPAIVRQIDPQESRENPEPPGAIRSWVAFTL